MSTNYKNSSDIPNEVLAKRVMELSHAVHERIKGNNQKFESEFTIRIPAELDRDADLVLSEAARRLAEIKDI